METKTRKPHPTCVVQQMSRQRITTTSLSKLGIKLGQMMDLMHEPDVKDETLRQIFFQDKNKVMISASNDDLFISFTVEKKGGRK